MHDIKAIRDNPDAYDRAWASKGLAAQSPSILDLDAVDSTIDVCKLVGTPMLVLLNRVPAQGREIAGTETAIERRGLVVASVRWGERKAFRYPFMKGLTAREVEPDSRAAVSRRPRISAAQDGQRLRWRSNSASSSPPTASTA